MVWRRLQFRALEKVVGLEEREIVNLFASDDLLNDEILVRKEKGHVRDDEQDCGSQHDDQRDDDCDDEGDYLHDEEVPNQLHVNDYFRDGGDVHEHHHCHDRDQDCDHDHDHEETVNEHDAAEGDNHGSVFLYDRLYFASFLPIVRQWDVDHIHHHRLFLFLPFHSSQKL